MNKQEIQLIYDSVKFSKRKISKPTKIGFFIGKTLIEKELDIECVCGYNHETESHLAYKAHMGLH